MAAEPKTQSPALPLEDTGIRRSDAVPTASAPSRWRMIPVIAVSLFAGAFIGLYFQPPGLQAFFGATGLQPGGGTDTPIAVAIRQVQAQEEVAVVSEGDIVALGRIIPRGDVINVAVPFGAGDARLATLLVDVGDHVRAGETLATLDNQASLQSDIDRADAAVRVSEAALQQTRATIRASREEALAALERSEATAVEAEADLQRATSLFERGVTTRADFDQVVARATEAARDVERNRATLSRYDNGDGTVQADIAVAEANLAAARVDLNRATSDFDRSIVRAPADGTVLDILSRVGERPGADGILRLGDTSQMTVEAEVYQTLIGRVAVGDPVTVTADALPQPLTGQVQAIGLEIGRQSITSDDPAANTDARVVDVIVQLEPVSSEAATRFTNLETVVRIDAGRQQ